jgi:LEA14-like dessication related protein
MRFLPLGLCVVLSGCSMFMRSIERPTAEVRTVSMTSASFGGVAGELHLDVMNPNSFGVPLSGIDWELSIGGARAVTGRIELQQTIPAKGLAPVTTSLSIGTRDAITVASALAGGARDYTIHAKLTFSTAVGPLAVEIDHTGQLGANSGGGRLLGLVH